MVKLLTLFVPGYTGYSNTFNDYNICCGMWMATGVEEVVHERYGFMRMYTLTCVNPHNNKVKKGDTRRLTEQWICATCLPAKVVIGKPLIKSNIINRKTK